MAGTEMVMMISMFTMHVLLGWLLIRWRTQVRKMIHEERLRALELNQPLPPERLGGRRNPYIWPLVFAGSGTGLLGLGLMVEEAVPAMGFGLVFSMLGLGWLLAVRLNRVNRERQEELEARMQESYLKAMEAMATRAAE